MTAANGMLARLRAHELSGLVGGSTFFFVSRVAGAALAYVTQIVLARWMGAAELGAYVFAFSMCLLLSTVASVGFPSASFRFIGFGQANENRGYVRGYVQRAQQIITGTSLAIVILGLGAVLLIDGLVPAQYLWAAVLALLCTPLMAMIRLHSDIANVHSWWALTILPNAVLRPLLFFAAVCAVWFASGVLSANLAMGLHLAIILLIAAGQFAVLRGGLRRELQNAEPEYDTRKWTRVAAPLCVILLLTSYFPEFNIIIVGLYLPADQLAIFNAAFRTAFVIMFGLNAVDAIAMPRISKLYAAGETAELQALLARATALKIVGALAALIAFGLLGKSILGLFGEAFIAGFGVLLILTAAQLMQALVGPVSSLLGISGHQDHCLYVFGITLVIAIVLNMLLLPSFGIMGAAVAVVLSVAFWTIWLYRLVRRFHDVDPSVIGLLRLRR